MLGLLDDLLQTCSDNQLVDIDLILPDRPFIFPFFTAQLEFLAVLCCCVFTAYLVEHRLQNVDRHIAATPRQLLQCVSVFGVILRVFK